MSLLNTILKPLDSLPADIQLQHLAEVMGRALDRDQASGDLGVIADAIKAVAADSSLSAAKRLQALQSFFGTDSVASVVEPFSLEREITQLGSPSAFSHAAASLATYQNLALSPCHTAPELVHAALSTVEASGNNALLRVYLNAEAKWLELHNLVLSADAQDSVINTLAHVRQQIWQSFGRQGEPDFSVFSRVASEDVTDVKEFIFPQLQQMLQELSQMASRGQQVPSSGLNQTSMLTELVLCTRNAPPPDVTGMCGPIAGLVSFLCPGLFQVGHIPKHFVPMLAGHPQHFYDFDLWRMHGQSRSGFIDTGLITSADLYDVRLGTRNVSPSPVYTMLAHPYQLLALEDTDKARRATYLRGIETLLSKDFFFVNVQAMFSYREGRVGEAVSLLREYLTRYPGDVFTGYRHFLLSAYSALSGSNFESERFRLLSAVKKVIAMMNQRNAVQGGCLASHDSSRLEVFLRYLTHTPVSADVQARMKAEIASELDKWFSILLSHTGS